MLIGIRLSNFKCFKVQVSFPLKKLNLLTGINGRGKSTLLQSLLLMKQSVEYNDSATKIVLNGSCINLGSFTDIRNSSISRNEPIIFEYLYIYEENASDDILFQVSGCAKYELVESSDDEMVAQINSIRFQDELNFVDLNDRNSYSYVVSEVYEKEITNDSVRFKYLKEFEPYKESKISQGNCYLLNLLPFSGSNSFSIGDKNELGLDSFSIHKDLSFSHIHYISADRLGPQEFYFKSTLKKFPTVGTKGEFTANLLYKKGSDLIDERLALGNDARTLTTQTEEWLSWIFGGAKVEIPNSDSRILELLFNTSVSKERFKPANVGYGYHCILPIVVSGLIAKEGEILVIENPEAHLHPKAQSRLTRFLAKVSQCGVQVFIESHSDHVLNALRVAVLDELTTPEDLNILYFQEDPDNQVVNIPVQANGGIEEWPTGFFDQIDKDFERLFGM